MYTVAAQGGRYAVALTAGGGVVVQPPPDGEMFSSLKPGTFRAVGNWATGDNPARSDYSCIVYDPKRKQWLFPIGGGHGTFNPTNIRAFPKATLQWVDLYPTMSNEEQAAATLDPLGFYTNTLHPKGGEHTYNGIAIDGDRLQVLTSYATTAPHWYDLASPTPGGRAWHYQGDATFRNVGGAQFNRHGGDGRPDVPYMFPWTYVVGCCKVAGDGRFLVAAQDGSFFGAPWIYDPATRRGDQLKEVGAFGIIANVPPVIVHYPPNDRYYCFTQGSETPDVIRVYEMAFNAQAPKNSVVTEITAAMTGPTPTLKGRNSYDRLSLSYDDVNKNIGGCVSDGFYHAFKPETREWKRLPLVAEAGTAGVPNQVFNCCARDPESNVLLVLNDTPLQAYLVRPPPFSSAPTDTTGQSTGLSATLDFGGGKVASFTQTGATDLGTFDDTDTGIKQRQLRAFDPSFPGWSVLFCPDVDGKRNEVVVGYGNVSKPFPNWMTPYVATIKDGANTLYTATVPKHFTYATWRWQSSPRPVVRTPDVLKARDWIPNFTDMGGQFKEAIPWAGPMTLPRHIDPQMGGPGDNSQIGFLTAAGASYMAAPSDASLVTLLAEAESVGTWPVHFYKADGSMVDVKGERAYFSEFGDYGVSIPDPPKANDPAWVVMDGAHQYASVNAAWLLTGDPYFLRCMQAVTTNHILQNGYHRINQKLDGLVQCNQTRAFAWGLRDLSLLACSTPVTTPVGFQPRAKWKACLDDNRAYAQRYMDSPARVHSLFRVWTSLPILNTWMSAWLTWAVGMCVKQGFSEWQPVFDWSVKLQLDMTDNSSGWDRRLCAEYQIYPSRDQQFNQRVSASPLGTETDAAMCKDWPDLLAHYMSGSSGFLANPPVPVGDGLASTNGLYAMHVRAALVEAVRRGTPGAQSRLDWLHGEIMRKWGYVQAQFAVSP